MSKKVYLGDSVYAEIDDLGAVILSTENGFGPTNIIVLEQETLANLAMYVNQHMQTRIKFESS